MLRNQMMILEVKKLLKQDLWNVGLRRHKAKKPLMLPVPDQQEQLDDEGLPAPATSE